MAQGEAVTGEPPYGAAIIVRHDRDLRRIVPASTRPSAVDPAGAVSEAPPRWDPFAGPAADAPPYREALRAALETGTARRVTLGVVDSQGVARDLECVVVPELDGDGATSGVLTVAWDLTEQRRTEQQLILRNFALDHVREAAYLIDEDGRFAYVNEAACRALGYSRDELLAMRVPDVDPVFTGDRWAVHWAELRELGSQVLETSHVTRSGQVFPAEVTASYFEHAGQGYNLALARDVSERREQVRFLESLDRVNRAIQGATDLETMLDDVLDVALSVFDCDRAFLLFPCDPEAETWTAPIERTRPEFPGVLELGVVLSMDPQVAETLRVLLASDGPVPFGPGTDHPLPTDVAERFGFRSLLSMALRPRLGPPWQFGLHHCARDHTWTAAERRLMAAFAVRLEDGLTAVLTRRDLLESEERYRLVFDNSPVSIWELDLSGVKATFDRLREAGVVDLDAYLELHPERVLALLGDVRVVDVNRAALRLLGAATRDELLARIDATLTPETYGALREELVVLYAGGPDARRDTQVRTLGGELRSVTVEFTVCRGSEESLERVLASLADITERKRAESEHARLAAAVDQAEEAIVITDPAGTILYVNPALERTSGYSRDELIGANPRVLGSGQHDAAFYRAMWECLLDGRTWHGTVINRRRDGALYEEDAVITPIRDPGGELVSYVGVKRDLTRERALESQLSQARKLEAVGQLAGGIAHDFNNLITAIRGYSELIRTTVPDGSTAAADVDEVILAADRATELTRQLLAFSRRLPLKPQVVAPARVVRDLAPMLRRLLGEDIELVAAPASDDVRVFVDRSQLEQVIVNLAVNSRDAMPEGGRLRIDVTPETLGPGDAPAIGELTPGRYVVISVTDTGTGMSAETRARAFEPFFTTKPAGKGTGMGLATVYGIVAASNGAIDIDTELGRGTSFRIWLPATGHAADVAGPADNPTEPAGEETILLVEDEDSVLAFARRSLTNLGYTVLEARNGPEALARAAEYAGPIHLLVTDVVMPGMRGTTLAERLEVARPAIRVLLMSGFDHEAIDHTEGSRAFLAKPYTRGSLARGVREALDTWRPDGA
jgi:PAS domain S-box-containing protein